MDKKISCVICAYNEGERIGNVLQAVVAHPNLLEVIVVDDGSTDNTVEVARSFPSVKVLVQEKNGGKSRALARGVTASTGEFIMILDADLKGLTPAAVAALAEPVLSGKADVSLSLRKNSLGLYRAIGLDFVSGERVFPRGLVTAYVDEIQRLPRFGIESFMNAHMIKDRMRLAIVPLDVLNVRKAEKIGWLRGTLQELKMTADILRFMSPLEVIRQNYMMLRLSRTSTKLSEKALAELSHE